MLIMRNMLTTLVEQPFFDLNVDWAEGIQVLPKGECQHHQNVVGQTKMETLYTKKGVPKEASGAWSEPLAVGVRSGCGSTRAGADS